jgi:peptidoglycan/xylan/chitin deacetylase (PgdA/CDA1 family)
MKVHPSIQASENPVEAPSWGEPAAVTLYWTCDEGAQVEVRVGAPDGPLLSCTGGPGTATTGKWLSDETTFYLQDVTGGKPRATEHTLATVTVSVVATQSVPGCAVLMYHRIAEEPWDPWELCVSPRHFAEHLEVLSRPGMALSLGQLAGAVRAGKVPSDSAIITFDDGYVDNLQTAKPLLERYGIPATVFVTSGYVGDRRGYWWDELKELAGTGGPADSDLYFMLYRWLRPLGHQERRICLDRLRRWVRSGPPALSPRRPMSVEELQSLASVPLIEIGSHTRTHPPLDMLPVPEQLAEIRESKLALEEMLNRPVTHFAYPHGAAGPDTAALVKSEGLESACLASGGLVSSGTDLFRLPRMQVRNWDGDGFSRRLSRWLATS